LTFEAPDFYKIVRFLTGGDLELLRGAAVATAKFTGLWLNAFDMGYKTSLVIINTVAEKNPLKEGM